MQEIDNNDKNYCKYKYNVIKSNEICKNCRFPFFLHCDLVSVSTQNQIEFFRQSDTLQRRPSPAAAACYGGGES